MHHSDVVVWQVHARVVFLERSVIPFLDSSKKDASQRVSGELDLWRAGKVVGWNHSAQHGGEMQDLETRRLELIVGHRPIGGAEIDRLGRELRDAAARANRLVIDLNVRMLFMIFVEPL